VPAVETTIVITNRVGLHARPARLLVQTAAKFQSRIQLQKEDKTANARSFINVLKLGVGAGDALHIHAEGEDAEAAIQMLTELIQRKFDEEE
jgi:phosphotransferase system HPr (HPr) family protein